MKLSELVNQLTQAGSPDAEVFVAVLEEGEPRAEVLELEKAVDALGAVFLRSRRAPPERE